MNKYGHQTINLDQYTCTLNHHLPPIDDDPPPPPPPPPSTTATRPPTAHISYGYDEAAHCALLSAHRPMLTRLTDEMGPSPRWCCAELANPPSHTQKNLSCYTARPPPVRPTTVSTRLSTTLYVAATACLSGGRYFIHSGLVEIVVASLPSESRHISHLRNHSHHNCNVRTNNITRLVWRVLRAVLQAGSCGQRHRRRCFLRRGRRLAQRPLLLLLLLLLVLLLLRSPSCSATETTYRP